MRVLSPDHELDPRHDGEWTNPGEPCRAQLPPLSTPMSGPFVFFGTEPHPVVFAAIEAKSVLLDGTETDEITIDNALGAMVVIRNVNGKRWHATSIVPNHDQVREE